MAERQPKRTESVAQGANFSRMLHKRNVMLGIGVLLGIAAVSVATILSMLERFEAKSASFHPPMTALERQQLLPQDPILNAAPKLDGLRYGRQVEHNAEGYTPVKGDAGEPQGSLDRPLKRRGDDLRADVSSQRDVSPVR